MSNILKIFVSSALVSITACAPTVITEDLNDFSNVVTEASKPISRAIADEVAKEEALIEDKFILENKSVLMVSQGCDEIFTIRNDRQKCELVRFTGTELKKTKSAKMQNIMSGLTTYLSALEALVNFDAAATGANLAAVLENFRSLTLLDKDAPTAAQVAKFEARQSAVSKGVSFFTVQIRDARLKTFVNDADETVQNACDALAAYFIEYPNDNLHEAQKELIDAGNALRSARTQSDTKAQRNALKRVKSAYGEFKSVEQISLLTLVRDISSTHTALKNRLKNEASQQEIVDFLNHIIELKTAVDILKEKNNA